MATLHLNRQHGGMLLYSLQEAVAYYCTDSICILALCQFYVPVQHFISFSSNMHRRIRKYTHNNARAPNISHCHGCHDCSGELDGDGARLCQAPFKSREVGRPFVTLALRQSRGVWCQYFLPNSIRTGKEQETCSSPWNNANHRVYTRAKDDSHNNDQHPYFIQTIP